VGEEKRDVGREREERGKERREGGKEERRRVTISCFTLLLHYLWLKNSETDAFLLARSNWYNFSVAKETYHYSADCTRMEDIIVKGSRRYHESREVCPQTLS